MTAGVITFSMQLGSQAEAIARAVAEKLDYRFYDRQVITEAASLAGVSPGAVANAERWPGFLERMLETLGRTSVLSDGLPGSAIAIAPNELTLTSADYRAFIEVVINRLADQGNCVIAGHAGQAILRHRKSGIYRVLVHGSVERRAERWASTQNLPAGDAVDAVKDADDQRIEFFKHIYDVDWLDSSLYDLALNTDEIDVDAATAMVLAGADAVPPV